MTETNPPDLLVGVPGGFAFSAETMAVIFDVTPADVRALLDRQTPADGSSGSAITFPDSWVQAGRRRFREASAALGSSNLLDIVTFLKAGGR